MLVGHLGDGNIHYAVVAMEDHDWEALDTKGFSDLMIDLLVGMGGTFSAEHGIGRSKSAMLVARKDAAQIALMVLIKAALDPDNLINSGVLFPDG